MKKYRDLPSDAAPTNLLIHVLANICRNDSADETHAEPTNKSPNIELRETCRTDGTAGLYYGTSQEDKISQNECPLAATVFEVALLVYYTQLHVKDLTLRMPEEQISQETALFWCRGRRRMHRHFVTEPERSGSTKETAALENGDDVA